MSSEFNVYFDATHNIAINLFVFSPVSSFFSLKIAADQPLISRLPG
jgi:hypothetical protein